MDGARGSRLNRARGERAATLVLLAALASCAPPLPQASDCAADRDCPAGYRCHTTHNVCEPSSSADADASTLDAGAADRALPDSTRLDAAALDNARPDTRSADAAGQDISSPDIAPADSSTGDASPPDFGLEESGLLDTFAEDVGPREASSPEAAAPDSSPPDTAQPDAAQPDAAQPDAAQSDAAQPDAAQPDAAQPDAAQPDRCTPVNGGWTTWSWSAWRDVGGCGDHVSCRQRREHTGTRTCTDPTPSCGGDDCVGSDTTIETDDSEECTILFWKLGNNGSVSCRTYCEDDEHWTFAGPPGTCVFADERIGPDTNRQDCDYLNPDADSLNCRCERCDP